MVGHHIILSFFFFDEFYFINEFAFFRGRLLKRSTPSIQNQPRVNEPSQSTAGNFSSPTGVPSNVLYESSVENIEPVFTVGEDPDMNIIGLSGARPLGS